MKEARNIQVMMLFFVPRAVIKGIWLAIRAPARLLQYDTSNLPPETFVAFRDGYELEYGSGFYDNASLLMNVHVNSAAIYIKVSTTSVRLRL